MRDQKKTEIKVGITVFIGLIILFWIYSWAKNITLGADRKIITVEFNSVAGLEIGDPVTVNGVKKGYVDDIKISDSKVRVTLNLDSDTELKDDSKFYVMMLDLMGGKKIEINPGSSENVLNYSKIQKGEFLGDISTAMAVLGTVEYDLVDVIKEIKITLSSLNKTLTDSEFSGELKNSVIQLNKLTNNLNELINNNNEKFKELLNESTELTKSVNNFIVINKDSLSATINLLKQTLDKSQKLVSSVDEFLDKTNKSENNLGRALNDKEIIDDLKVSIKQLKDLTQLLLEQLKSKGIKVDAKIDLF
ncbi:MlaD family protein [Rosettibacter firmus]|uniref:MlaD family protein n=1 Tax=Rosettibacter firmus TaxID=3111522 RepID=UPI00336BCB69